MDKKNSLLLKDTITFAFGSLGSKLILFFLVPLYTNYLTTAEYGISDLVQSFSSLIIPISYLSINEAVIRYGMKKDQKKENVILAAFLVLLFATVFTIVITPLLGFYEAIADWKYFLAISVILSDILEVEKCCLKIEDKNKSFALLSILLTLILAGTNILLIACLHKGIAGYLASSIIAMAICALITFFVARIPALLKKSYFDKTLLKEMLLFSIPLIFTNISWWVIHSTDKIMIEMAIGASALGMYTLASKIPSLINVIVAIFNQAWGLSSIREAEGENDSSYSSATFHNFSIVIFGAALIFEAFIRIFMKYYVGADFSDSWKYTPLLLTAAVYYSLSAFIGSLYSAYHKTVNIMVTTLICAFLNVLINYIFINIVGVWGAIIGTVSSYFAIAIIRMLDIQRFKVVRFDWLRFAGNSIILFTESLACSLDWNRVTICVISAILFFAINAKDIIGFLPVKKERL